MYQHNIKFNIQFSIIEEKAEYNLYNTTQWQITYSFPQLQSPQLDNKKAHTLLAIVKSSKVFSAGWKDGRKLGNFVNRTYIYKFTSVS
jgi:hypothetical protein